MRTVVYVVCSALQQSARALTAHSAQFAAVNSSCMQAHCFVQRVICCQFVHVFQLCTFNVSVLEVSFLFSRSQDAFELKSMEYLKCVYSSRFDAETRDPKLEQSQEAW